MNMKNLTALIIPILIIIFLVGGSLFTVQQAQQALVLQFGELIRTVQTPGLKMKIPFMQDVVYYDKRMLDFDVPLFEVTLGDQKRIVVDSFTRYRIVDPGQFYKTVRNEDGAQGRLAALIPGILRSTLGNTTLPLMLSPERDKIMAQIRQSVNEATKGFGIQVVDVRIRRTDLPPENREAIFNRMISERQREAQEFRAQGKEMAQGIRANADRERTVILAEAQKQASILKGQGDQEANRLYAESYGKAPEFAIFYRSLEAYRSALANPETTLVLPPKGDFFSYFNVVREK